jgi:hypothetical protein
MQDLLPLPSGSRDAQVCGYTGCFGESVRSHVGPPNRVATTVTSNLIEVSVVSRCLTRGQTWALYESRTSTMMILLFFIPIGISKQCQPLDSIKDQTSYSSLLLLQLLRMKHILCQCTIIPYQNVLCVEIVSQSRRTSFLSGPLPSAWPSHCTNI